jgi:aryl-phospho-beta-D-glucosidase BglC (GH1 family)
MLDFMAEFGFDFLRVPANYRFWTQGFDYFHPDRSVFAYFDSYLEACQARGIQLCLNLHRAPGYCINRNDLERHNLWTDPVAQQAFVFLWELLAERYRGVPASALSFDLLNEPPPPGQYGMTRESHAELIRRVVAAIWRIDPRREILIDGLDAGNLAMPELADLGAVHSGRGYQPMGVSHYQATWWSGHAGLPEPRYPGEHGGKWWDLASLREFYQPWREVERRGAKVQIGEFGCYNHTPNAVALRWLGDLLTLYQEFGWGYAMWNFSGPFGIAEHGRPGTTYQELHGYQIDRELLQLMVESRTPPAAS